MTQKSDMVKKFSAPRGTADILPQDISSWQKVESTARMVLELYGYREIRTPIFEENELFVRSMGESSDVVQKQMLKVFGGPKTLGEALKASEDIVISLALRPEGTASIVRSYIENSIDKKENFSKFYYIGPMFRGERPQKGRLRQFHQIGVEAIGPNSASPYLDAEVIALSVRTLEALGLSGFKLKINTLGSPEDKENFSKSLRKQLQPQVKELCEDCQNRLERNVFRILDCKNKACQAVVAKINLGDSYLSEESRKYFAEVRGALDRLNITYEHSPHLVRGLDYYTHTVFEISSSVLGSQDALGAGGRYNNLVSQLGGPAVDAIGFALGIERILLAIPQDNVARSSRLDAYLIALDEPSLKEAFSFLENLRRAVLAGTNKNLAIDMGFRLASMKSQMRTANDRNARFVMILGENELKRGIIMLKDMATSQQEEKKIQDINGIIQKLSEGTHNVKNTYVWRLT